MIRVNVEGVQPVLEDLLPLCRFLVHKCGEMQACLVQIWSCMSQPICTCLYSCILSFLLVLCISFKATKLALSNLFSQPQRFSSPLWRPDLWFYTSYPLPFFEKGNANPCCASGRHRWEGERDAAGMLRDWAGRRFCLLDWKLTTSQSVGQKLLSGYCPASPVLYTPFPGTNLIIWRLDNLQISQANINCCSSWKYIFFFLSMMPFFILNKGYRAVKSWY